MHATPSSSPSRNQIKQREQIDPDDIHEMPVEAGILERDKPGRPDPSPDHKDQHHGEDHDPDQNMEPMQSGHDKIEAVEKDLPMAPC